ncbi:MAG TPA: SUMF1/EgtB/PvdO family nonheme iron enzyme [Bacteroidales bacterium]|nr:SUMF1/EgtB/PvdO family nonheme iron enzyme [Bacteroidales bacterium]
MSLKNNSDKVSAGKKKLWLISAGFIIALVVLKSGRIVMDYTSTDEYCMSCHIHPMADQSWKLSTHYNNPSGNVTGCAECHLPPKGKGYLFAKAKHGFNDLYGYWFKDSAEINWEAKKLVDNAKHYVYEESCLNCHTNLFPVTLSVEGSNAHYFYTTSTEPASCISCHLNVGHYDRNALHAHDSTFGVTQTAELEIYTAPPSIDKFESFTEKVPGTTVSFNMIAVQGGTFNMGSPETEPLRDNDEGPLRKVTLSPFWIGEVEVTWDAYLAFFRSTGSQGRTEGQVVKNRNVDAISGPTPPWGAPDQGWGKGQRPAITMSWHAANVYCQWLSKMTGRKYRLPTEAEWEYACRGGSSTPYFFEGNPKKLSSDGFLRKILGPDTSVIASRVMYKVNSNSKTAEPASVKANPLGLKNMAGNVAEFCLDWYSETTYKADTIAAINPRGPAKGKEHVIRGGSFKSDAKDVRSAARDFTKTTAWLVTDPQVPKSIWWYSDVIDVGFRVVCEPDTSIIN